MLRQEQIGKPEINWRETEFYSKMKKKEKRDKNSAMMCFKLRCKNDSHRDYSLSCVGKERRKLIKKKPHTEVSKLEFREMVILAVDSFDKNATCYV